MFFEFQRDLPQVERLIFDCLGPRDLVKAKRVCRNWAVSVRRYIGQLDANRTSDLMRRAFLEPLPSFIIVEVPQRFYDLTINIRKEIYLLGTDRVMRLDSVNFQVEKTMMFKWREGNLERIKRGEIGYDKWSRMFVNKDGSQFLIRDPGHAASNIFGYRKCSSQPDILRFSTKTNTRMVYNADAIRTKILSDRKKMSKRDLLRAKASLKATYIVQLAWDLYLYTASDNNEGQLHTFIGVARMSTTDTFVVKNIANIKMNPLYVKLRVVGTRVFCYEKGKSGADWLKAIGYKPSNKIAVFDIWNPDSVESDGVLTNNIVVEKLPGLQRH